MKQSKGRVSKAKAAARKKASPKTAASKKKMPKKKKAAKKKASPKATMLRIAEVAAAGATGCCTIKPPGEPDFDIPHITQDDCRSRALAMGAAWHWRAGECAGV